MNKILILFAHPRFEKSKTNRALLQNIEQRQGVTLNDLYEQYPDFNIDIDVSLLMICMSNIPILILM